MLGEGDLAQLAPLGVGGLIAVIIFHWYRKDVKQYTDLWKGQAEALIQVVKENTAAITSNTDIVRALHRRLDRDQLDWNRHNPEEAEILRLQQHGKK